MSSIQEIQKQVQDFMEFAAPAPVKRKRVDPDNIPESNQQSISIVKVDYDSWFPFPQDEDYDPSIPNDYESIILERRKKKKEQERELKLKEELIKLEKERQRGATKVDLGVSAQQVFLNRSRKSKQASAESKVKKMMHKMGWKGSGLGKDQQGILTPLIAKKHSSSSGKIVQSQLNIVSSVEESNVLPKRSVEFNRAPSRVVMLLNTSSPEQAGQRLGQEIGQECLKFGKVLQVEIRVVEGVAKQIAVRVFVLFDKQESAIKAVVDLGVRYFNGKPVFAFFFDQEAFQADELIPPQKEIESVIDWLNSSGSNFDQN